MNYHYRNIYSDPRFIRWLKRLDPSFLSKRTLKNAVDPASIPFVGNVVKTYRAKRSFKDGVSKPH